MSILDGYDFISDQYIATFSPNITQAVFNISLMKNSLDKSTEYLILHLYIPSDSYEYGVQKGNSTTAMVSVLLPGIGTFCVYHRDLLILHEILAYEQGIGLQDFGNILQNFRCKRKKLLLVVVF